MLFAGYDDQYISPKSINQSINQSINDQKWINLNSALNQSIRQIQPTDVKINQ